MTIGAKSSNEWSNNSNYSDDASPAPSTVATTEDLLADHEIQQKQEDFHNKHGPKSAWTAHRIWYHMKSLVLEPGFLVYMVASVMGNLIASDLQLDRACRVNLGYNDTICDLLLAQPGSKQYEDEKLEVQRLISDIGTWVEVIENFFPILFSLFLGGWTDVYGTKFPFLLSIGGVVVRYAGLLLCVYYEHWNVEVVSMFSILPGSLTGGRIAISMVIYSFVAVTTSLEDRTIRVGILTVVRTFGRAAGSALGGLLKRQNRSYNFIFGIGGALALISFLYTLAFLPNPKKGSNPYNWNRSSKWEAFKNIFNFRNIIESAKSFLKKRPFGIRTQLYLLVIVLIFTMAPMQGEDAVLNLFVRNTKILGWSTATYGEYQAYRMLIAFAGGLISVGLLVKVLKMMDWKIGFVSCFSQIGGCFLYAFANSEREWMMYVAPVVDVLNGTMIIAARTMISKIIPIPEMGKINCIVAVIDATTPLWGNPIYMKLYRETLDHFPGAFMMLSAALTIVPIILFLYFGIRKHGIPIDEQAARHEQKKMKKSPNIHYTPT